MNDCLKLISKMAELNQPIRETYYIGKQRYDVVAPKYSLISTHVGRKSFICNALAMGISPQIVMKWTGHNDYKSMKPYIDVVDAVKADAMKMFNTLGKDLLSDNN